VEFVVQGFHKGTVRPLPLPCLPELFADARPDFFLYLDVEIAIFHVQQHHVGTHFLRTQGRDTDRHLDELVEIVDGEFVGYVREVAPDRIFDHCVVRRNYKSRILQEQDQADRLKRGDRGFRQTTVEIIDQDDQRYLHRLKRFLEAVPEGLYFLRGRRFLLRIKQPRCRFLHFAGDFNSLFRRLGGFIATEESLSKPV